MSQCSPVWKTGTIQLMITTSLSGLPGLNVVRSGRPEQSDELPHKSWYFKMSQCSPVWKTGTIPNIHDKYTRKQLSQCSPVWKTGTMPREVPIRQRFVCLNVVRSGRPEQFRYCGTIGIRNMASQCSPVWKTGTMARPGRRS